MAKKLNRHHSEKEKNAKHLMEKDNRPVSQEEFDEMVKVLLNTPPRKRNKK